MATRRVELGPVGERVAENLASLRKAAHLEQRDVALRVAELGRPIQASAVSKLELGQRRVDADDLVTLALALGVTPNRLLLAEAVPASEVPFGEEPEMIEITPTVSMRAQDAWMWACGDDEPNVDLPWAPKRNFESLRQFQSVNRPHQTPQMTLDQLAAWRDAMAPVLAAAREARRRHRLPMSLIVQYLVTADSMGLLAATEDGPTPLVADITNEGEGDG